MSVEAPVRPRRRVEGILPEGKQNIPGAVIHTDFSLLGRGTRTEDRMPALAKSNPECHHTRAQSCATCPLVNCSLKACSNPCN